VFQKPWFLNGMVDAKSVTTAAYDFGRRQSIDLQKIEENLCAEAHFRLL